MKQSRQIPVALLASILSVALCIMALVGTTLAWFTDAVENQGNNLQAGSIQAGFTLNGEPIAENTAALQTTSWESDKEETLTFEIAPKENSLPFTYSIWLKGDTPDAGLARYLEVYQVDGTQDSQGTLLGTMDKLLNSPVATGMCEEGTAQTVTLKIKMGNVPLTGIDTTSLSLWFELRAEQIREPVTGQEDLASQLSAGGLVQLGADLTVPVQDGSTNTDPQLVVTQDTVLDLGSHQLTLQESSDSTLLEVNDAASLVINSSDQGTQGTLKVGAGTGIQVNGGTVTITGGQFAGATLLQMQGGSAVITEGVFCPTGESQSFFQCSDGAKLTICGGTFVNFDPSSWLAGGYQVVQENPTEGETWYTVKPE